MKKIINTLIAMAVVLFSFSEGKSSEPNKICNRINNFLIQIQSYRPDLEEVIKPFTNSLTLSMILQNYPDLKNRLKQTHPIINEFIKGHTSLGHLLAADTTLRHDILAGIENLQLSSYPKGMDSLLGELRDRDSMKFQQIAIEKNPNVDVELDSDVQCGELGEIIAGDKIEKLQSLIQDIEIEKTNITVTDFKGSPKIKIPLIQYCIMKKAKRCFKYLLVNGYGDPKETMEDMHLNDRYKWDCMAMAIYLGSNEIMKILEERGIEKGKDPAHMEAAVLSYRNHYAKEILENMRENDHWDRYQILNKGIFAAVNSNNIKLVEILISQGINIHIKDNQGRTPLHCAAEQNSKEVGKILISKGSNIYVTDKYGRIPLHYAAWNNSNDVGEVLLDKCIHINTMLNAVEKYGWTALHYAAMRDSEKMGKTLISKGAHINAENFQGAKPMHIAAIYNSRKIIESLYDKSIDINEKNGYTTLHYAAEKNSIQIGEFLLSHGADINARNFLGDTPLHIAARNNSKEFFEFLISNGADINIDNKFGETILHYAAKGNSEDIGEILLRKWFDINAKDKNIGRTALHCAAIHNSARMAELLIIGCADINSKDYLGMSALHYAVIHNSKMIVELLLREGAYINSVDNYRRTPLSYALEDNGKKEIADLLLSNRARSRFWDFGKMFARAYKKIF